MPCSCSGSEWKRAAAGEHSDLQALPRIHTGAGKRKRRICILGRRGILDHCFLFATCAWHVHTSSESQMHNLSLHVPPSQALQDGKVLDVLEHYKCLELVVTLEGAQAVPSFLQRQQQQQQQKLSKAPKALRAFSSEALSAISRLPEVRRLFCV